MLLPTDHRGRAFSTEFANSSKHLVKDRRVSARSLGTHRVMHPPAASKSQNIWVADLHRLAGPLPPSVRLPSEGWSAVVGCDVCNVKRRLKYVNRLGLIF